jgi:hypothetical protein
MDIHLVDGTYELFRHFFAVPSGFDTKGMEVGAVRGVLASVLGLIEGGATHVGVATDQMHWPLISAMFPALRSCVPTRANTRIVASSNGTALNNGARSVLALPLQYFN